MTNIVLSVAYLESLNALIDQLRAELAAVTAESAERGKALDVWRAKCAEERAAHTETRKALEERRAEWVQLAQAATLDLESTRAELAKAEARVKEAARITRQLQISFEEWPDHTSDNDLLAQDMGRIIEALRSGT